MTEHRRGVLYGIAAYGLWGIIPLYWKLFDGAGIGPVEILAHRAIWGLGAFVVLASIGGELGAVRSALRDRRAVVTMVLSGVLLAVNWGTFVAAVAAGRLLDASLGYFINPLVSIALGMVVLGERPRRLQWLAIGLAAIGVVMLSWSTGAVPWIALVLALTFGTYGLVRKTARVASLAGSTVETALMTPVAIGYLVVLAAGGGGAVARAGATDHLLLISTGLITAVPLLLFTSAARRLPLSTVGFLQYLAPTGQFVLAIATGEPVDRNTLLSFGLIWAGLAVFSFDIASRSSK